jgi:hypothetical protein
MLQVCLFICGLFNNAFFIDEDGLYSVEWKGDSPREW